MELVGILQYNSYCSHNFIIALNTISQKLILTGMKDFLESSLNSYFC